MPGPSALKVGRTSTGYCVYVEGHGTLHESHALDEFAHIAAGSGPYTLTLDLSNCDYLDSTFLGCIVSFQRHSAAAAPAFAIVNPSDRCRKLFKDLRLESILTILQDARPQVTELETIPTESRNPQEIAQHIMQCHRRLAEIESPKQAVFAKIADQFEKELQ